MKFKTCSIAQRMNEPVRANDKGTVKHPPPPNPFLTGLV